MQRIGIIDMGTNTFHLLIAEVEGGRFTPIAEVKKAVRLGKGGISDGRLAEESQTRALECLAFFAVEAKGFGLEPGQLHAFATSAVRSASNGPAFVEKVRAQTGIAVQTIEGAEEAGLIFEGVRASGVMDDAEGPVLVMDIGGGSVEFILGTSAGEVLWLRSFELGGQRLIDIYMKSDPIAPTKAAQLVTDMTAALAPLAEACRLHPPRLLVGASGTFDTLRQLEYPTDILNDLTGIPWREISWKKVDAITDQMQRLDRAARLAVEGVSELRADMIVVALLLLRAARQVSGVTHIRQCNWALKEGAARRIAQGMGRV